MDALSFLFELGPLCSSHRQSSSPSWGYSDSLLRHNLLRWAPSDDDKRRRRRSRRSRRRGMISSSSSSSVDSHWWVSSVAAQMGRNRDGFDKFSQGSRKTVPTGSVRVHTSPPSDTAAVPVFSRKRTEVRVPGLAVRISAEDVLGAEGELLRRTIDVAVAEGFTLIILDPGMKDSAGGARLYESACLLKQLLRGRASLLVAERVDIAAAAGAGGVLLSDQGLPSVVARNMMQSSTSSASVLPLVARTVDTMESALNATSAEGADLLVVVFQSPPQGEETRAFIQSLCQQISIPVFIYSKVKPLDIKSGSDYFSAGASGIVIDALGLRKENPGDIREFVTSLVSLATPSFQSMSSGPSYPSKIPKDGSDSSSGKEVPLFGSLDFQAKEILEEERTLLSSFINLIQEASPQMEEASLLLDALMQLDEPFLLVVVGEFNSGKSSVINALLGNRYLPEGLLPTTNEITVLKHVGEGPNKKERSEQHPDGHFIRYLPTELLKQTNLVDTPGTNVILQRQQLLTEEYIPRADLVLFVLSADRPLTGSEVTFLQYIRQWGKKVIFLLNKIDIFSGVHEVGEVVEFVKDNAERLLGVEKVMVHPVSARNALKAKLMAADDVGNIDGKRLEQSPIWLSSGFSNLENFIGEFVDGSSDVGVERLRLKLDTPLGISSTLISACERQLLSEFAKAEADLKVLSEASLELQKYLEVLRSDASLRWMKIIALIEAANKRADNFVDSLLRVSNIEASAQYLLAGNRTQYLPVYTGFQQNVIGSAVSDIRLLLDEYQTWLRTFFQEKIKGYNEFVKIRWPNLEAELQSASLSEQKALRWKELLEKSSSESMGVLDGFDVKAAIVLLEQEVKEVFLATFGGLGVAGASASVLTSILPTTSEDLIALGICSAGGLAGVWNLPSRRAQVKKKVQRVARSLSMQIETSLKNELESTTELLTREVDSLIRPYQDVVNAEVQRVKGLQVKLEEINSQTQKLRFRVQNLGISPD